MSTILEKIAGIESEVCVLFWPDRRLCMRSVVVGMVVLSEMNNIAMILL